MSNRKLSDLFAEQKQISPEIKNADLIYVVKNVEGEWKGFAIEAGKIIEGSKDKVTVIDALKNGSSGTVDEAMNLVFSNKNNEIIDAKTMLTISPDNVILDNRKTFSGKEVNRSTLSSNSEEFSVYCDNGVDGDNSITTKMSINSNEVVFKVLKTKEDFFTRLGANTTGFEVCKEKEDGEKEGFFLEIGDEPTKLKIKNCPLIFENSKVTGLPEPLDKTDAVTKEYVDLKIAELLELIVTK